MEASSHPPKGLWKPQQLQNLYYGHGIVTSRLSELLPTSQSKAFILTGRSLSNTPLIQQVETLLGPTHHAATYSCIREHAPVSSLEEALEVVQANPTIDTIISIGGGSPIDAAKWISFHLQRIRSQQKATSPETSRSDYLMHIAIPTTLSAAECTAYSAYTDSAGMKASLGGHPALAPSSILYDPDFATYTPKHLWLTSGVRALDHAVELMYHPNTTEVPAKAMCMYAFGALSRNLRQAQETHPHDAEVTIQLFLAAFASFQFLGGNMTSGLGLSHALGYALGAPYKIPHGVTSCMTLGRVVKLKAERNPAHAEQIARLLPYLPPHFDNVRSTATNEHQRNREDALKVGDAVMKLMQDLHLTTGLSEYGVDRDQVDIIVQRALGTKVGGSLAGVSEDDKRAVSRLVSELF